MKFNNFIANYKNNHKFPHALLLETSGCNDYDMVIKTYLKGLMCSQNIFCDECAICKKINNNYYIDLIIIDCSNKLLSKEDVIHIQKHFMVPATEINNVKLYSIINIENANKEAMNSLLKFIEEPPLNTYGLFFCQNEENILTTIKSRCQRIKIVNENNINDEFINYCFQSKNQYEHFIETYNLEEEKDFFRKIVIDYDLIMQVKFIEKIKKSSNEDLIIFIRFIAYFCVIEKRILINELQKHINLNINKYLLAHKILNILEK